MSVRTTKSPPSWLFPEDLVIIGLDVDVPPGEHPLYPAEEEARLTEPLDPMLTKSIANLGVLQSVAVRVEPIRGPTGEVSDAYVVVAGRRRVRHARAANEILEAKSEPRRQVPVTVLRLGDASAEDAAIVENSLRRDLELRGKIQGAQRQIERGRSEAEVGELYGVAPRTIRQWLAIADCVREVWDLYVAGRLTLVQCEEISRFPKNEQAAEGARLAATARVRDTEGDENGEGGGSGGGSGRPRGTGPRRNVAVGRGLSAPTLQKMRSAIGEAPEGDLAIAAVVLEWVCTGNAPEHPIVVAIQSRLDAREEVKEKKKPGPKPNAAKAAEKAAEAARRAAEPKKKPGPKPGAKAAAKAAGTVMAPPVLTIVPKNTPAAEVPKASPVVATETPTEAPVEAETPVVAPAAAPVVPPAPSGVPATLLDLAAQLKGALDLA